MTTTVRSYADRPYGPDLQTRGGDHYLILLETMKRQPIPKTKDVITFLLACLVLAQKVKGSACRIRPRDGHQ